MSSDRSSKSGCFWIALVTVIVGLLFYIEVIKTDDLPGLGPVVKIVAGFLEGGEEAPSPEVPPLETDKVLTWTSRTGTTIEASVLDVTGTEAKLEKEDGEVLTVKRSDFSELDRLYLTQEYGPEEKVEIPREKPRIRVSSALKSWRKKEMLSNSAIAAISIRNLENYAIDDVEVFWTWAYRKGRIRESSEKPVFHSAERTQISLARGESIVITTSPTNTASIRAVALNDCLIVQVFVSGEMVEFEASKGNFEDWAENEDLQKIVGWVNFLVDPNITNALGNAR